MMFFKHYRALSKRAIISLVRQPATVGPAIAFPLLFMAIGSSALGRSTQIPGFPRVDSFLQFMIPATIIQGVLFGSIAAGADMATDIERGFFERLISSPVSRTSILLGRVTGSAALGFTQCWIFLAVGLLFGLNVRGGLFGMFLLSIICAVLSAGIGALMVAVALKTGSTEAVQGIFPLIFVSLFLSSAFFPRNLMHGWFKGAADLNPLSRLVEGMRYQVVTGSSLSHFSASLVVAASALALGLLFSLLALRGRLALRS